ncbi:hypothetical protein [Paenibacillus xylaniclasticus]|uniref:hypothetical protein n=1 Tax=Paenibacillus xylaniclasticus TaxID=588083 RepID=UPI000FDBB6B7|nr:MULTISPECIES: hypothetical protein [Paenibacillus]GFN34190.1 hypothetical protein PCURB6_44500 [Paenibacillus curdlanolyticus]
MRIEQNNFIQSLPRLYLQGQRGSRENSATWQEGHLPVNRPTVDLLEISPEARQLAADAIIHHEAERLELPERPVGTPDDYIPMEQLMKRFDPETYDKFQSAIANDPFEGLSILLNFAKQVPKHPDWIVKYREENS